MIERITSNTNPDFLFLCYSKKEMNVKDFIFVPKYFFVPEIIRKMLVEQDGLVVIYY